MAIGITISVATLLFLLGGIELAGFIWEQETAQGPLGWTLVASRRLDLELHGAAARPYNLLESDRDYLWEGIPVHINSVGIRSEEFEVPKPPGVYRILNLGDSVAFGWEVQQSETYGKLLERILNDQDDALRYEVINAGIPTWTLEEERNFLLQEGLNYEPDLVILDITLVNDIYGRGVTDLETNSVLQWLRANTYGWSFLTTQARFLLARQRGPEAIPALNPPHHASAYYPLDDSSPIWDEVWSTIADMHTASQNKGIPFAILVFPTALQLNAAEHPDVPQRVLQLRAENAGILLIDLLPIYRKACEDAATGACEGFENLLFADVWMHPNPLGHQLAADTINHVLGAAK